jgi:hypothetical protein
MLSRFYKSKKITVWNAAIAGTGSCKKRKAPLEQKGRLFNQKAANKSVLCHYK